MVVVVVVVVVVLGVRVVGVMVDSVAEEEGHLALPCPPHPLYKASLSPINSNPWIIQLVVVVVVVVVVGG
jgi:hypothetical protein